MQLGYLGVNFAARIHEWRQQIIHARHQHSVPVGQNVTAAQVGALPPPSLVQNEDPGFAVVS